MDATPGTLSLASLSLNIETLLLIFNKGLVTKDEVEALVNRAIQGVAPAHRPEAAQILAQAFGGQLAPSADATDSSPPVAEG